MMTSSSKQEIAQAAARIMWEEGVTDYAMAKRKAANRLGLGSHAALPSNAEVEKAWQSYQALFDTQDNQPFLESLCSDALSVMRELSDFNPHVVGDCANGKIGPVPVAEIHLFCDSAKDVAFRLLDLQWPVNAIEREYKMSAHSRESYPGFDLDECWTHVSLTVFPHDGLRNAPRSAADGKPILRLSLADLESRMNPSVRPSV